MQSTEREARPATQVSIVLTCYNQSDALEASLRTCLAAMEQKALEVETIIINDGSTDGSVRTLDRLRKEFPNVRLTHQLHSGRSRALRRGFAAARGTYVFQPDTEAPEWGKAFVSLWEARRGRNLVLAYHESPKGLAARLQAWWVRLWFGARLSAPQAPYRLVRRDWLVGFMEALPVETRALDLALSLGAWKTSPESVAEQRLGAGADAPLHPPVQGRLLSRLLEVVSLRLRPVTA